jgi:MFS family permease
MTKLIRRRLFNNVRKSYVAAFLKNLQFFGAITIPFFIDWLRVDYTKAFLLQAWFVFWLFLLEIPTGVVADKFGRKLSVGFGCFLFTADMALFGLVTDYYVLYVAEFLGAAGITLVSGAEQALLYDSLIELGLQGRARIYLARYEAASTLGLLIAFPTGSLIAGLRDYPRLLPVTFLMTAVGVTLAAVMYLAMSEPQRTKPAEGFIRMGIQGLRTLFAHKKLRAFVLNAVTISAVTFFAFWFYQPVGQRAGLRIGDLGFVAAGFNLFSTLLLANVKGLERLLGMRRVLFYSGLIPAVLFVLLGVVYQLAFVVPALFLIVGCKMVRMPILSDFMNRFIESRNRATVISSVSLLERFLMFLLYPIVGLLADVSIDYALLFLGSVCAVFAVATKVSEIHLAEET